MDILYFILGLGIFVFLCVIFWRISQKAGYPGALGLLMFLPLVNIITLATFAFRDWPIFEKLSQSKKDDKIPLP